MRVNARELSHRARAAAVSMVSSAARTSGRDASASFKRPSSTRMARIIGGGHLRLQLSRRLIKAEQRGQRETREITIVLHGTANDIGSRCVGSWRARFQVADIAGSKPCVGDIGEPPCQLGILGRQSQTSIGGDRVRMRGPDLGDQRERIPHEPFADGPRVETRRGNARRTLPQGVEGILQGEFQLLGSDREEQREDGIPQQSRFRKISASDAQVDSVAWNVGLFQSAMATASSCVRPSADVHVWRKSLLAVEPNSGSGSSRADRLVDVVRRRRPLHRRAARAANDKGRYDDVPDSPSCHHSIAPPPLGGLRHTASLTRIPAP